MFGQGLAGIIFRESWLPGWLAKNAPHINYKVYPMPVDKMEPGIYTSFAWAIMVNKNSSEDHKKWAWEFFKWYINNPELRTEHYVEANILPSFEDTASQEPFISKAEYDAWSTMIQGRTAPAYYIPPAHEVLQAFGQAVLMYYTSKKMPRQPLIKLLFK